jgi:hypothetical protein
LINDKRNFINKKIKQLKTNKKYGFQSASEYIKQNEKHKFLGDKVQRLRLKNEYGESEEPEQCKEQMLDDLVPGTFTTFPVHKLTKLIEKDFIQMKY